MNDTITNQPLKRNIAFKLKIGAIVSGKPLMESERLKSMEIEGKQVVRVNLIANIVDKYIQDGEKRFGSVTLDDATGQIKLKAFGEDVDDFSQFNQGDTVLVVGLLRSWNNEIYITPEIMKKKTPQFLLLRKLEIETEVPKTPDKSVLLELKDKIITAVKDSEKDGGIDIEKLIMQLKEHPDIINQEIKKLLEEGLAYEPRPGKIRWLG